jgi:hypothetical protein
VRVWSERSDGKSPTNPSMRGRDPSDSASAGNHDFGEIRVLQVKATAR